MNALKRLELRKFVFGLDARLLAGRYAKNYGARKVLIVTDPGIISAGCVDDVISSLDVEGVKYSVFSDVHPNPRAEEVMNGAKKYNDEGCNVIIAVGGGSPIDCAKGIGLVTSNEKYILEFEGVDQVSLPGPPLICIPTTAGSSADVSQFAIINDTMRKVKIAIISKMVVPDVALIDPLTLKTMSPYLTACTVMDSLTHAIEAFVSNAQSSITDIHALEAIKLISNNLIPAIRKPGDIEVLGEIMMASLHAGIAFSNASLGAVHAMAHSLGGFLDHPHGECNAILLKYVINYNFDSAAIRYKAIGEAMGLNLEAKKPYKIKENLFDYITNLQETIGINRTLGDLGVFPNYIPELAAKSLRDPCIATNPRIPNSKDIEVIYEQAL